MWRVLDFSKMRAENGSRKLPAKITHETRHLGQVLHVRPQDLLDLLADDCLPRVQQEDVGERQLVADEPAGAVGLGLLLELTRETEGEKRDNAKGT